MDTAGQVSHQESLQKIVKYMVTQVTPERDEELKWYWDQFSPQFRILDDDGPDGPLIMDAGGFVYIRFNHRIMRLFWLASFALWEGYCAFHHYTATQEMEVARFREIVDCFEATCIAVRVDDVAWPAFLPAPGVLVDYAPSDPGRVGGELAIFGVSWVLLHELRHLVHQQEGTSADESDADMRRQEELSCDAFATLFLLERVKEFAHDANQEASKVSAKRQTGVYCALFALTLLAKGQWGESESHPAVQERIDKTLEIIDAHGMSRTAAVIAISGFMALKLAYPDAPDPVRVVSEVAIRDNWTPSENLF